MSFFGEINHFQEIAIIPFWLLKAYILVPLFLTVPPVQLLFIYQ